MTLMKQTMCATVATVGLLLTGVTVLAADDFQSVFSVDKKTLGVKGENPFFNLTPGYILEYRNGSSVDTITVLDETKMIGMRIGSNIVPSGVSRRRIRRK